jgi:hypothetical protein
MIKKIIYISMFTLSIVLISRVMFSSLAYNNYAPIDAGRLAASSFENSMDTEPSLSQLGEIFGRIFNTALFVAGGVLVVMIAYGAWKSAMATGDPRGLESAKQTWSYALYGFIVVVIFFALFLIITNIFGIKSFYTPDIFIKNAFSAIEELVTLPTKK